MEEIRNIFCIGRNYAKHAAELGNAVPEAPILFSKPTHALALADGKPLSFPDGEGAIHHELEIVLKINREVQKGDQLEDIVDQMALGLDLTLRDLQTTLKGKGQPWLRAKGFRNSAIVTEFWPFPGADSCKDKMFSLQKNGQWVQQGTAQQMIFNFQAIIDECVSAFGLGAGDIIFTGTPEGVGPVENGDSFKLYWGNEEKGSFQALL